MKKISRRSFLTTMAAVGAAGVLKITKKRAEMHGD